MENKPLSLQDAKQPYFQLSTNEFGRHWLFYKPLINEPGKYGCWMPIDDEFYNEFASLELQLKEAKEQLDKSLLLYQNQTNTILNLQEETARLKELLRQWVENIKLVDDKYIFLKQDLSKSTEEALKGEKKDNK